MTGTEFMNSMANRRSDILQEFLDFLRLIEAYPDLVETLPRTLIENLRRI